MLNNKATENNQQIIENLKKLTDDELALAIKRQVMKVNLTKFNSDKEYLDMLDTEQMRRPVKTHPILLRPVEESTAPARDPQALARDEHIKYGIQHAKLNRCAYAVYVHPKTGAVGLRAYELETCPNVLAIITPDGRVEMFERGSVCVSKPTATVYKLVSAPVYDERFNQTVVRGVALSGRMRGKTSILPVVQLEMVQEAA